LTSGLVYLLDANVFIEAARRYYAFDLAPKFWDSLIQEASRGAIESIDRVKQELAKGQDELADWINGDFDQAFCSTNDAPVFGCYAKLVTWVQGQEQFTEAAKADFASGADGWLVAYAIARERVVVTHEVASADIKRKVPIPNMCDAFEVEYIDTFKMMRDLGVRFA